MKIVQGDTLEWERGLEYRGGMFHFRRLMEGEPGTIDNFQLSLGRVSGDFYSPRHRHNFEQIRFQIADTLSFSRDGKMSEGTVGYFPEGMAYGPQTQEPDAKPLTAVLQFGGASGSGYLSRDEVKAGMDELKKFGTFEGGVYRRNPGVAGKKNLDGYQAIWENQNGRAMVYPKPRYNHPIFMDSKAFAWVPVDGAPGVSEKLLGVFSERRVEAAFVKIEAGASYTCDGPSVVLATQGAGHIGAEPVRAFTTIWMQRAERASIGADQTIEMLRVKLPDLSGLGETKQTSYAHAAE